MASPDRPDPTAALPERAARVLAAARDVFIERGFAAARVEDIAARLKPGLETRWRLAVLLHDAPEYVIGDMISPFKAVIGGDYKAVEARLMAAIHIRFGLPAATPAEVAVLTKKADHVAAFLEATQLAGFALDEAAAIFGSPAGIFGGAKGVPPVLVPLDAEAAKAAYLARFTALGG